MPKHKTLIVFAVVVAFSFSLIGCGALTSRSTGPDDVAGFGDDLPEWLLLAHRSAEGPGTERDDDLVEIDDDDLTIADSDLPIGGSDQEDSVAAPSSNQGTQTAQAPQSSQPSSTNGGSSSDSDEPEFGTKEHLIWLHNQQKDAKTVGEKEAEKAAEEAVEDGKPFWNTDGFGGGGIFGN